jgi:hypothetical protein
MANYIEYQIKSADNGLVHASLSFAPNGTSAVSAGSVKGRGVTVTREANKTFTVELSDVSGFKEFRSITHGLQLSTAAAKFLQIGDVDGSSFVVRVVNASGTIQDVAADENNRIHLSVVYRTKAV